MPKLELADTSAWIVYRHADEEAHKAFAKQVLNREIVICEMVKMELLYGEIDANCFQRRRASLEVLPSRKTGHDVWERAVDVFGLLAELGPLHHRQVTLPDLLIAATAELGGVSVLHYDGDFDTIAAVTSQPVRAVAPLGSIDQGEAP